MAEGENNRVSDKKSLKIPSQTHVTGGGLKLLLDIQQIWFYYLFMFKLHMNRMERKSRLSFVRRQNVVNIKY